MPLQRWYPMPRDLDTGRVTPAVFSTYIQELLGRDNPGGDGITLCVVALKEWDATGDPAWLARLPEIAARVDLCLRPGAARQPVESVERFRAWYPLWLREIRAKRSCRRATAQQRASARKLRDKALTWASQAKTEATRRRWEVRAEALRLQLLEDAQRRWQLQCNSVDGRARNAARRARKEIIALGGSVPPPLRDFTPEDMLRGGMTVEQVERQLARQRAEANPFSARNLRKAGVDPRKPYDRNAAS